MIIITKKLRPRRLVAGCALAAVAIAAVGAGLDLIQDVQTAQAVVQLQANPENVKTNDDRVAYLESCGWLVGRKPPTRRTSACRMSLMTPMRPTSPSRNPRGSTSPSMPGRPSSATPMRSRIFLASRKTSGPAYCSTRTKSSAARYTPTKGMGLCRGWPIRRSSKGARVDLPPSDPVPPGAFPFLGFQLRNKKAPLSPVFTDQREGILLPPV